MRRVRLAGDPAAFAQLVGRWEPKVRRLCVRMTGDEHRGKTSRQEAFARVFANRHRYDPRRRFSTWLWRVASTSATRRRACAAVRDERALRGRGRGGAPASRHDDAGPTRSGRGGGAGGARPRRARTAARRPPRRRRAPAIRRPEVPRDRRRARHGRGHGEVADDRGARPARPRAASPSPRTTPFEPGRRAQPSDSGATKTISTTTTTMTAKASVAL